jgi:hypothetical protein
MSKATLKGGVAGKPQVKVRAQGASLQFPATISGTQFFEQDPSVIVQLHSSDPVHCWSSSFAPSSTKKNDGMQFKATAP